MTCNPDVETHSREFDAGFFFRLCIRLSGDQLRPTLLWPNRPARFTPAITDALALAAMDWRRTCLQDYIDRHGYEITMEHLDQPHGWHFLELRLGGGPQPATGTFEQQSTGGY